MKISCRAYIFQRPFLRGISTEGNLCLKIDWASLIVGSKFTVFALFLILYIWGSEKFFGGTGPPLSKGLDDRVTPLSQGRDLALSVDKVMRSKWTYQPTLKGRVGRYVYVAVNFFISVSFCFSFVVNSLAYITIPKNNGKIKINWNKELTTTCAYTTQLSLLCSWSLSNCSSLTSHSFFFLPSIPDVL